MWGVWGVWGVRGVPGAGGVRRRLADGRRSEVR
jgi:hypothetical protein